MKRILVTGGAGYIGAHTSKQLAEAGYEPVCYDNLSRGHAEFVKWGPLEIGDLHDSEKLTKVIRTYQPVAIIHFAAFAYVGESILNPLKYYRNNVSGTVSLLQAMHSTGIENIVFSSSCATYGIPDEQPISESCHQEPINPYGHSKLMIERILRDLSEAGTLKQVSLRYFNAAGADRDGTVGEKHDPETHLIPLAITSAIRGASLNIYGTDFSTPDGTAVRDYIHVEDLGRAHVLALKHLLAGGQSDFINLGTGLGTSVREIVASLQGLGVSVSSTDGPRRSGDPASLVADPTKARHVLNWEAQYTKIEDILKSAIEWHKTHG